MNEDLQNAKKFRKFHQANAESQMLNKALKEEQEKIIQAKMMEDADVETQQLERILKQAVDETPYAGETSGNQEAQQQLEMKAPIKGEVKKRLTLYQRRDLEFQKVYEKTIMQLRDKHADSNRSISTDQNTFK